MNYKTYLQMKGLIFFIPFMLTSCSMLSPVQAEPESSYTLNTVPKTGIKKSRSHRTLLVTMPEILPAYDTVRMAYTTKPYEISYFANNRWIATPSQMLLPLIVQTLQNTHYFHAVINPPVVSRYHYVLNTKILELQQNFMYKPARLTFVMQAQLIKIDTNELIASKQFSVTEFLTAPTPYAGVRAANKAEAKILTQLSQFVIQVN